MENNGTFQCSTTKVVLSLTYKIAQDLRKLVSIQPETFKILLKVSFKLIMMPKTRFIYVFTQCKQKKIILIYTNKCIKILL